MKTTSKVIIAIGTSVSVSIAFPAFVGLYQFIYTGHASISEPQAFLSTIVGLTTGFITAMVFAINKVLV